MPKTTPIKNIINSLKEELLGSIKEDYLNRIRFDELKPSSKSSLLAMAYRNRITKEIDLCNKILKDAKTQPKSTLKAYELEVRQILEKLSLKIDTFLIRLAEFIQIESKMNSSKKISVVLDPDYISFLTKKLKHKKAHTIFCPVSSLKAFKIINGISPETLDAYILLSTEFDPDELDSPLEVCQGIKRKFQKYVTNFNITGKKATLWDHSILVVVQDAHGITRAVADGTLIVQDSNSVFYTAHIVVDKTLRSKGIGVWVNDILLQAAENSIQEAIRGGIFQISLQKDSNFYLSGEISEIEFPDKLFCNENSFRRLPFYGRMGHKILWPLLYAQPDTNYHLASFELENWFSLPMFLCFRVFNTQKLTKNLAITFTTMLFDYFSLFYSKGSEWDRKFLEDGLKKYPYCKFISFPTKSDAIEEFIRQTGCASEILMKYYPDHNYSRERKEIIFLLANTDI